MRLRRNNPSILSASAAACGLLISQAALALPHGGAGGPGAGSGGDPGQTGSGGSGGLNEPAAGGSAGSSGSLASPGGTDGGAGGASYFEFSTGYHQGGGGGGGGSGIAGTGIGTFHIAGPVVAGRGGDGGQASGFGDSGGGGGAGGYGIFAFNNLTNLILDPGASVTAGNGGNGAESGSGPGNGGDGGIGIYFGVGGSSLTVNQASIAGGAGGAGGGAGFPTPPGAPGAAGAGVEGVDLTLLLNDANISGSPALKLSGNSVITRNGGTLTGGIRSDGTLTLRQTAAAGATGDGVYGESIAGNSGIVVESDNGYAVRLAGTNSFVGDVQIAAGTLTVGNAAALGAAGNQVTFNNTTLRAGANLSLAQSMSINSGTNATIDTNGFSLTANGVISGNGGLIKNGNGVLKLAANNSFSGNVVVSGGTLAVASDAGLGAAGNTLALNSGTLRADASFTTGRAINLGAVGTIDTNGNDLTVTGPITGQQLSKTGSGVLKLAGSNSHFNTVIAGGVVAITDDAQLGNSFGGGFFNTGTLRTDAAVNSTRGLSIINSGTINTNGFDSTFSGRIQGLGSLTKTGSGRLTLAGDNVYTGGTTIAAGTLVAGHANAVGTGKLTVNAGATFELNTTNVYLAELEGDAGATVLNRVPSGVNALTVGSGTFAGAFAEGSPNGVANGIALLKTGSGTLTLTGQSTHRYGTTVQEGRLLLNNTSGSALTTGISVQGTGLLGGTGSTTSTVTLVEHGVLAPGDGVGTLSIGRLVMFQPTATIRMDIMQGIAPSADLLNVNGEVLLNEAVLEVMLSGPDAASETSYLLINNQSSPQLIRTFGTVIGLPAGWTVDYAFSGYDSLGRLGNGNDVAVRFDPAAVPEPSAMIVAFAGLGLGMARRRRIPSMA